MKWIYKLGVSRLLATQRRLQIAKEVLVLYCNGSFCFDIDLLY